MSRQSETVDAVFQYPRVKPAKKNPPTLELFKTFGDITIAPVHEPEPAERYRKYKRICKTQYQPAGS